jgi:hypothetical protein
MFDFTRRFTRSDPVLKAAIDLNGGVPTDEALANSPSFIILTKALREYSVLLANLKYSRVYQLITQDSDPEIALILLSALNAENQPRYTIEQIEALLWGGGNLPRYAEYSQGVTEISIKFAAAIAIGAFAVQEYQYQTAEFLRKQALISLDRISTLAANNAAIATANSSGTEGVTEARFYFEPLEITLATDLTVSFFIPNAITSPSWTLAVTYPAGQVIHTRKIAADIALAINRYTLNLSSSSNIIAAVSQSGQGTFPYIDFALREYILGYNGDLVSVQFEQLGSPQADLPFKWGVEVEDLYPTFINSCILLLRNPKGTALSTISTARSTSKLLDYNVLYFRSKLPTVSDPTPSPTGDLTYRLSVSEQVARVVSSAVSTAPRYSQQAIGLMNSLQALTATTRLLGCIVRDDLISESAPMAAVELIAWSVTSPITYLVLDILSVPADIEIALGDIRSPQTTFSNLPLTIICKPLYERALGAAAANSVTGGGTTVDLGQLGSSRHSGLAYELREKVKAVTDYNYN